MKRTTLIIAAASPLVLRGLADLLHDAPELRLLASMRDPFELFSALQTHLPDVLVADRGLASALGDLLRPEHHHPRMLLLGGASHPGTDPASGSDLACGFVGDRVSNERLLAMLRSVALCNVRRAGLGRCRDCQVQASMHLPRLPLSPREYDVFVRIGHGQRTGDIATALGVSVKTIETYREHIKHKLELDSAHALLLAALAWRAGDFLPGPAMAPARRGLRVAEV